MDEILSRKDIKPSETIKKIKEILEKNSINTELYEFNNNENLFSCRVVIKGTDIGTNGKGISKELAFASAYAEFMERIQTGFLFEKLSRSYKGEAEYIQISESAEYIFDELKRVFPEMVQKSSEKVLIERISKINKIYDNVRFYDVLNDEYSNLPNIWINRICGSNGLCAGNSYYEAVCQGICENLERMALKNIMESSCECPEIPRHYYNKMNSYKLIETVEKRGYQIVVKDCTLNGTIPVIGVMIVDCNKRRMRFGLGCDINFDIALQRCMTEMLQGYELDAAFDSNMYLMYDSKKTDMDFKLRQEYIHTEHNRSLTRNGGYIPEQIIVGNLLKDTTSLEVFINGKLTNEEAYFHLLEMVRKINLKLYLCDYSFMGFPTYRVFMGDESVAILSLDILLDNLEKLQKINNYDYHTFEFKVFLSMVQEYNKTVYFEDYYNIDRCGKLNFISHLYTDTRILETMLLVLDKQYKQSITVYKKYFKNDEDDFNRMTVAFIKAYANGKIEAFKNWFLRMEDKKALEHFNQMEKILKITRYELSRERVIQKLNELNETDNKSEVYTKLLRIRRQMNRYIHENR